MLADGVYEEDQVLVDEEDPFTPRDFGKLRMGLHTMDNVLASINTYKRVNPKYGSKTTILNAINQRDYNTIREISKYFYESSGIYKEICDYAAYLFKYDWYVTCYADDLENEKEEKILKEFSKALLYLDRSDIKKLCGDIALQIMVEGAYYGIMMDFGDRFGMQALPPSYCRVRFYSATSPIVELSLRFFDTYFTTPQQRMKVLKLFPEDIQKAYILYRQNKLKGDYPGEYTEWVALDPGSTVKISLGGSVGGEMPPFAATIPSIIDLDEAQALDREKTLQQLVKILVQKLPLDKNGDLIFDVDEAKDIHNNAVAMLKRANGIDVLTTFADIEKIDTRDTNSNVSKDDLEKVERTVYNNAGVSKNLFNADGNLAVATSILVKQSSLRQMLYQFGGLLNKALTKFNKKNRWEFRAMFLETTEHNFRDISKAFKEQVTLGYQKMLPSIAMGQSQSDVLATILFENEVLHLADIMQPPQSSNTLSAKSQDKTNQSSTTKNQNNQTNSSTGEAGRPEKPDTEKSDKTIQNAESAS